MITLLYVSLLLLLCLFMYLIIVDIPHEYVRSQNSKKNSENKAHLAPILFRIYALEFFIILSIKKKNVYIKNLVAVVVAV